MSLPPDASRLPLLVVTFGLRAWERTRRPREVALRRGAELVQIAAHTPLGLLLPAPTTPDGHRAEAEAERIATEAHEAAVATVAAASPQPISTQAEKVTDQLDVDAPKDRGDLPIPDFDNITLGSLRARLRSLALEDLAALREWELAHAHRAPVLTLLDNRIAKLAADSAPAYPVDPQGGT